MKIIKTIRIFSVLIVITILFQIINVNPVGATNKNDKEFDNVKLEFEIQLEHPTTENISNSDQLVQPNSASGVIMFKDTAVGWLIDGSIEYLTGRPPSEWVSWGLQKIEDEIVSILSMQLYSQAIVDGTGVVHPYQCTLFPFPITPNMIEE